MSQLNFGPASREETMVFGAARPGHPMTTNISDSVVNEWMDFMEAENIKAVCCLLGQDQLDFYQNPLLKTYEKRFGKRKVCSAPVADFTLVDEILLITKILPFLSASAERGEKVVVHCSAGVERTAQVLEAWLVYGRGFTNDVALEAVFTSGANRSTARVNSKKLDTLLDACRFYGVKVNNKLFD